MRIVELVRRVARRTIKQLVEVANALDDVLLATAAKLGEATLRLVVSFVVVYLVATHCLAIAKLGLDLVL